MAVPAQIMQLLGHAGLRRVLANHQAGGSGITLQLDEADQEEAEGGTQRHRSRRRKKAEECVDRYPPVPNKEGKVLMDGGTFGISQYYRDKRSKKNPRLARRLMSRELGPDRGHSMRASSAIAQVYFTSHLTLVSYLLLILPMNQTNIMAGYATVVEC